MVNDKIKVEIRLQILERLFAEEGILPDYLFEIYKKLLKEVRNEDLHIVSERISKQSSD